MTPRERAEALFSVERVTGSRWDVWHASGRCVGAFWTEEAAKKAVEEEAAPIAAAIESALAEQAAGEAERTAQAVARAYEDAAGLVFNHDTPAQARARIRARATLPAAVASAERGVIEAVLAERAAKLAWIESDSPRERDVQALRRAHARAVAAAERALDALAAARKGGSR